MKYGRSHFPAEALAGYENRQTEFAAMLGRFEQYALEANNTLGGVQFDHEGYSLSPELKSTLHDAGFVPHTTLPLWEKSRTN